MSFEGLNIDLNPEKTRNYPYNANTKAIMGWFKPLLEELEKAPADVDWKVVVECATNISDIAKGCVFIQEREANKKNGGKKM